MVFHMSTIGINGFSNVFFIRYDGFSMVFYRWTIGIDGFSNGFSIRDDVFSMVFYRRTIGIDGFPMVFPFETMVSQWFFTVGPLVSMVFQWFPMVANHWSNDGMVTIHRYGLQYMLNIAQCTCTHLLKGRAHIK